MKRILLLTALFLTSFAVIAQEKVYVSDVYYYTTNNINVRYYDTTYLKFKLSPLANTITITNGTFVMFTVKMQELVKESTGYEDIISTERYKGIYIKNSTVDYLYIDMVYNGSNTYNGENVLQQIIFTFAESIYNFILVKR